METILESLLTQLKPYFDEGLRKRDSEIYLFDEELGDQASCCITGQTAGFYAAYAARFGGKAYSTAELLTDHAAARQLSNGAFEQPYYVRKGESGTVDIAEIGAVANALFHVHKRTGSEAAKTTLLRSADYLLGQVAKENPGAVYKNPNAMTHDVLNGDIYAARR